MTKRRDKDLLQDMLEAIENIENFIAGIPFETFDREPMIHYAVIKGIEIIGEAATKVSSELKKSNPNVPWRQMIGMRNILVHVYHDADLEAVFEVANAKVCELKSELERMKDQLD